MPVAYPSTVPRPLKATKSRTQPASFRLTEPRRGYGYAQAVGTDTPVFWDVSWVLTQSQAAAFQLWFDIKLERGLLEFDLPLRTEFGDVVHTCRFLPDTLLPARTGKPGPTRRRSWRASCCGLPGTARRLI